MRTSRELKLSDAARDVLARSTVETINNPVHGGWLLKLPAEQLERSLYVEVDKALKSWNGKWNRHQGGHVFTADPSPLLLAKDGVEDKKWSLQQFFTPADVAKKVVELAGIPKAGIRRVLEPSAGDGALACAILNQGEDVELLCFEKDPDLAYLLNDIGYTTACVDFLQVLPCRSWDYVVMNPPYRDWQYVTHVLHALKFLRPGGRLAAIVPANWRDDIALGEAFDAHSGVETRLERGAFRSSGTDIATSILVFEVPHK